MVLSCGKENLQGFQEVKTCFFLHTLDFQPHTKQIFRSVKLELPPGRCSVTLLSCFCRLITFISRSISGCRWMRQCVPVVAGTFSAALFTTSVRISCPPTAALRTRGSPKNWLLDCWFLQWSPLLLHTSDFFDYIFTRWATPLKWRHIGGPGRSTTSSVRYSGRVASLQCCLMAALWSLTGHSCSLGSPAVFPSPAKHEDNNDEQLRDDNNSTQTHKRAHTQVHNLTFLVFFHQLQARSGSQTVDRTRSWRTSDSNHSSSSIKHFRFSVWLIHFKASWLVSKNVRFRLRHWTSRVSSFEICILSDACL